MIETAITIAVSLQILFLVSKYMIAHAAAADVARDFLMTFNDAILYPLITLMLAVALLIFLWGCFEFIMAAGDPGARTTGKKHILWGIVGMVIMVSAYGILTIAVGTFGLDVPN